MIKHNGMEFQNSHDYEAWLLGELVLVANNKEDIYNLVQRGLYRQAYTMAKSEIEAVSGYKVHSNSDIYNAFVEVLGC